MLPRTLAACAAAVVVSAVLAAPQPAAPAQMVDLSCTYTPPPRIAVRATVTSVVLSASGTCKDSARGYGSWYLDTRRASDDFGGYASFGPGSDEDFVEVYDDVALGVQTWHPQVAGTNASVDEECAGSTADADCDTDLTDHQNAPTTEIKMAGAPWLYVTRSGTRLHFHVTSHTWSPTYHKFVAHSMRGELQVQNSDGTWRRYGPAFTTTSTGMRDLYYSFSTSRRWHFRYVIWSTTYSWYSVSSVKVA